MRTIDLSKQQMLDDNPKQKENKIILQEIWIEEDKQQCNLLLKK